MNTVGDMYVSCTVILKIVTGISYALYRSQDSHILTFCIMRNLYYHRGILITIGLKKI